MKSLSAKPSVERLEAREQPAAADPLATTSLVNGVLTVTGNDAANRINVFRDGSEIIVTDQGVEVTRVAAVSVNSIVVNGGAGDDVLKVSRAIGVDTTINGGGGNDRIAGSGGINNLTDNSGRNVIRGGVGFNNVQTGENRNNVYRLGRNDSLMAGAGTREIRDTVLPASFGSLGQPQETLTTSDVDILLRRASAASASNDAIIAILDRNGRVLGVRVEDGVAPEIRNNNANLVFAVDGAIAKARTGAFFGNNAAPLTSRTIQNISESTITQREVESNPNVLDLNSTERGPGFVANVGINAHFPHGIAFTPQVDLFQIEHTNRDSIRHPGNDLVKGTADDVTLQQRFDLPAAFVPAGQELTAPESFGVVSGLLPTATGRGIATLPGGIPIVKNGQVVGGIGVFFPGRTGFATEENSSKSTTHDPSKPDRTLEAEWIAFAALGGFGDVRIGDLGGIALPKNADGTNAIDLGQLPDGLNSIYLVGIFLEVFGPGGEGTKVLQQIGNSVGRGDPNSGTNVFAPRDGQRVPEGWLVRPHDGDGISAADVEDIIQRGIEQAFLTRAAIRFPLGNRSSMVFAVADKSGEILGLYRMADSTIFSIDVAVAKARNVAYYADAESLQPQDQIPGVPAGTALTNRSFRYLGEPRFPLGINGTPPAPFSQLLDGGADPLTGLQVGARLPASAYQSVVGFDAFNPMTNFRDPNNRTRQNGIVFFPGSAPLYRNGRLIGGFGVSGDGVDQDDVVTDAGQRNFGVPLSVQRIDQLHVRGVRVPYQKSLRNPEG